MSVKTVSMICSQIHQYVEEVEDIDTASSIYSDESFN